MLYFYTECSIKLIDARSRILSCTLSVNRTSIQNSGIDDAWIEAEVYRPSKQDWILTCIHHKRSLRAHIYTCMALYELALKEFLMDYPDLFKNCAAATAKVEQACSEHDKQKKSEKKTQNNTICPHHSNGESQSDGSITRMKDCHSKAWNE